GLGIGIITFGITEKLKLITENCLVLYYQFSVISFKLFRKLHLRQFCNCSPISRGRRDFELPVYKALSNYAVEDADLQTAIKRPAAHFDHLVFVVNRVDQILTSI